MVPGDEIRHIDWRAYGKTDRYYVKEYEEETNLKAYLVVDSSGSMAYAGRTVSKFEHARRLAAALAYLAISQRDAVGLVTFDSAVRSDDPAPVGPEPLLGRLPGARADAAGRRDAALRHPPRPGRADPPPRPGDRRFRRLRPDRCPLRGRCNTCGTGITRCCSSTLWLPRKKSSRSTAPPGSATSSGSSEALRVDPLALRAAYLERFRGFCQTLKERIRGMDADYHRASTAEPVERTLLDYLASRSRRGRGG